MNYVALFILAGQKKVICGPDLAHGSLVAEHTHTMARNLARSYVSGFCSNGASFC